ncbi:hypothetical protein Adu01nite_13010 [Paractinoplanes durhamensis]|uniref:Uncharacterized protein n=1 Tax=Paractinoplanes durhamensis TaxID=113563 RepID=A0ABQ3YQT3_9ACTN|nr:hypothetical protein Adu01nite_13010 [Actinoplanes durhamensis]
MSTSAGRVPGAQPRRLQRKLRAPPPGGPVGKTFDGFRTPMPSKNNPVASAGAQASDSAQGRAGWALTQVIQRRGGRVISGQEKDQLLGVRGR